MKYADVMALRDLTIRDILLTKLGETDEEKRTIGQLFEAAVQAANKDLAQQLRDMFGRDVSDRILERMQQTAQSAV